jgi:hypothetical protein
MVSFESHQGAGNFVVGLMDSGGSAMWNQALDIVQAMKTKQQAANPPIA